MLTERGEVSCKAETMEKLWCSSVLTLTRMTFELFSGSRGNHPHAKLPMASTFSLLYPSIPTLNSKNYEVQTNDATIWQEWSQRCALTRTVSPQAATWWIWMVLTKTVMHVALCAPLQNMIKRINFLAKEKILRWLRKKEPGVRAKSQR